jgi:hypothetical protein
LYRWPPAGAVAVGFSQGSRRVCVPRIRLEIRRRENVVQAIFKFHAHLAIRFLIRRAIRFARLLRKIRRVLRVLLLPRKIHSVIHAQGTPVPPIV